LRLANEGFQDPALQLHAPFLYKTKADIVTIGANMGVPFEDTWSCYKGGSYHCGSCGTCVERHEAFVLAGVADKTIYQTDPRLHLVEAKEANSVHGN
jgi:7-cyano-7-deazaguanine synthase